MADGLMADLMGKTKNDVDVDIDADVDFVLAVTCLSSAPAMTATAAVGLTLADFGCSKCNSPSYGSGRRKSSYRSRMQAGVDV